MKLKLILGLALVLSGVLLGCSTVKPPAQPIPASSVNWMGLMGYLVFGDANNQPGYANPGLNQFAWRPLALALGINRLVSAKADSKPSGEPPLTAGRRA